MPTVTDPAPAADPAADLSGGELIAMRRAAASGRVPPSGAAPWAPPPMTTPTAPVLTAPDPVYTVQPWHPPTPSLQLTPPAEVVPVELVAPPAPMLGQAPGQFTTMPVGSEPVLLVAPQRATDGLLGLGGPLFDPGRSTTMPVTTGPARTVTTGSSPPPAAAPPAAKVTWLSKLLAFAFPKGLA